MRNLPFHRDRLLLLADRKREIDDNLRADGERDAPVKVAISHLGVEASLRALEELSAGDAAQRAALSGKLEQLEYEATKAFEQYDAVDARNRLAAGELERRWTEKLEEIEADDRTGTRCQIGSFGSGST